MDLGIKGKRALVLGSSAGIGKGIAAALAREGAEVMLIARNVENLKKTADEIGAAGYMSADLRSTDAGYAVVHEVLDRMGGVDILVTNSGGPPKGLFDQINDADWMEQYQNLWMSPIQLIRSVLPGMRSQNWGRILLVTSVAAKEPIAKLTISNALRAGLLGLVNSISKEIAADGITINSILPGYTATERLKEFSTNLQTLADSIPAKRLGTPEELGNVAAFLCSDRAGYITGQALAYDGGLSAGI